MILFKNLKLNKLIKALASSTLLLILLCTQVNALPLSLTFGEEHLASFVYQNGETYLSLGHKHSHDFHHENQQASHQDRAANIFNGHDGSHKDHFVQVSDSSLDSSNSVQIKPDIKHNHRSRNRARRIRSTKESKALPQRNEHYHKKHSRQNKNYIQVLA